MSTVLLILAAWLTLSAAFCTGYLIGHAAAYAQAHAVLDTFTKQARELIARVEAQDGRLSAGHVASQREAGREGRQ